MIAPRCSSDSRPPLTLQLRSSAGLPCATAPSGSRSASPVASARARCGRSGVRGRGARGSCRSRRRGAASRPSTAQPLERARARRRSLSPAERFERDSARVAGGNVASNSVSASSSSRSDAAGVSGWLAARGAARRCGREPATLCPVRRHCDRDRRADSRCLPARVDRADQRSSAGASCPVRSSSSSRAARLLGVRAACGDDRLEHRSVLAAGGSRIACLDLVVAAGPAVQQRLRDAGELEVAPAAAGAALDRKPERREFAGELGAIRRADLAAVLNHVARIDRHEPPIAADARRAAGRGSAAADPAADRRRRERWCAASSSRPPRRALAVDHGVASTRWRSIGTCRIA